MSTYIWIKNSVRFSTFVEKIYILSIYNIDFFSKIERSTNMVTLPNLENVLLSQNDYIFGPYFITM